MQDSKYPGVDDSYARLTHHLLNVESPLNYSLEYLLDNYGERAVPALLQAFPVRPWYEQQLILEALGKLGDINAIEPICALLYTKGDSAQQLESSVINSLRNLVYYCSDKKKATNILLEIILRYEQCAPTVTAVLKEQKNKYTIKMSYKKLFPQDRLHLKEAAVSIVGEEVSFTEYRIKILKKMLYRVTDPQLRAQVVASLKLLISKKRCERLCNKKGMKFDAFFRRPDNECFDCCCVDKNDKRVLIKFEGGLMPGKKIGRKINSPNPIRPQSTKIKNTNNFKN